MRELDDVDYHLASALPPPAAWNPPLGRKLASRSSPAFERANPAARRDWVVVLRCGAGRHRYPPRVGELVMEGKMAERTRVPLRPRVIHLEPGPAYPEWQPPRSLRFPCGVGGCPADWSIDTARLAAAYRRAVAERRRTLTFGVDL